LPNGQDRRLAGIAHTGEGGKQVKQDCAVCHKLSVLINGRECDDGEAVTLRKGETHTVKVKDTPVPRDTPPGGDSSPPHTSNQKFTVWPKAVDGQTITSIAGDGPADSPQVFIAKKAEILQYLLDNSERLMAQNKDWPEDPADEPMNKTARLLPVQIEARKQGTTAAPETGLLVKKGDVLEFALAPQFFDAEDNFETLITWQYRQLNSDGTYTGWTDFGSNGTGTKFEHTTTESGIFQIKATVQNAGEHFHVRKKSDPHTSGGHELKKGDADSIGVTDTQIQIDIVAAARLDLGSTAYAVNVANGWFEVGTNKCNLFVAEKAQAAGAAVPLINFEWLPLPPHSLPPVANQWAGIAPDANHPAYTIANWNLMGDSAFPQPGLIVASGFETWATGHAGIVDYDGRWVSAGSANVNRNAEFKDYKIRTLTGGTRPAGKRKYSGN
jgi:hypothetical protein